MSSRALASQNDSIDCTNLTSPNDTEIFGTSAVQCCLTNAHARALVAGLERNNPRYRGVS
jgi:hypothetical protein